MTESERARTERDEPAPTIEPQSRLLVIGRDVGFSLPLIDYSIELAVRMDYSIIAVNLRQYGGLRKLFSEKTINIADDEKLEAARADGVGLFAKIASVADVPFEATGARGELDEYIRLVGRSDPSVALVVVEPEFVGERDEGPRSIPVFSLANCGA